jgi:hypothetical protein
LNRRGAIALSRSVAAVLASVGERQPRAADSARDWIVLGAPSENASGWNDGIEDIDESRRIVRSDPATRMSSR